MTSSIKKQTVLFILSVFTAFTAFAQWGGIKGNGNVTTISRTTGSYDGVKCAGSMDFILVSGNEGKITIEGEENLLEHIITEVKGDNLIVKVRNGKNLKSSRGKTIKITIPVKDISNVSLSGSGDLWNEDKINTSKLDVALSGSGDVVLNIDTTSAKGAVAGSGDLTLKGNTNNLVVKVAGSGDFHGFDLNANNTEVAIAGSGGAKVVSNESIKARISGSGDIVYAGNPKKEDTKVAGSGSIRSN
ncbi:head GIN domain-containing protein [Seonamhaeicola marinus]|uniref:DUF2807 domain-containing protein n=1 Tax=Seonamhaeicola marinus TaxID=1912246 RepID=A0A5D0HL44_9FLAO|nr:head GIN domain-containing protein [Seonamhaeicola marinus]TYA71690.1 DUF2807 domain-containing protein [Seonamhaeicola marinus]